MLTMVRRLFLLGMLGGGGYAGWMFWQQRSEDDTDAAPEWPPLVPPSNRTNGGDTQDAGSSSGPDSTVNGFASLPTEPATQPASAGAATRWVVPLDGECPDGYPIKANDNSGIFHVPGGRFYDRTVPERCYDNTDDAVADGYRAAKS